MWHRLVFDLAAGQHGLVSGPQILGLAPSEAAARHERESSRWTRLDGDVFRSASSPVTDVQLAMHAVLASGPGSTLSHDTAAAVWGLPGFNLVPVHVTRVRASNGRKTSNIVRHEARKLGVDQVTAIDRLPVTRPERVPFDLANTRTPAQRIERAVDRLWSDRLVSYRSLHRVLLTLPRRGFRGTVLMRELLEARGPNWIPPASGLEGRVQDLLERNGCGGFERQVDLGGDEWVGRVDFVHLEMKLVIEVQSDRHHAALSSRRDDALRFARLREAGFAVIEAWENDVWHRPALLVAAVRRHPNHRET